MDGSGGTDGTVEGDTLPGGADDCLYFKIVLQFCINVRFIFIGASLLVCISGERDCCYVDSLLFDKGFFDKARVSEVG